MADALSQDVLDLLPEDFEIEIASLPDDAQDQVIDAVHVAYEDGDLPDLDVDETIADAEIASEHRENVETLHQEQADAVEAGDLDAAHDYAQQAEWEVREVQDHGGEGDAQLDQAQADQANIENAQWEGDIADGQVEYAAQLAEGGQVEEADALLDSAADHMDVAADSAGLADQGGHYEDHSYDSAASTGDLTTE